MVYSSFLGGPSCSKCYSAQHDNGKAVSVAVDALGYAYVGGRARSPAFPSVDPFQDQGTYALDGYSAWPTISKVSPLGDKLVYSLLIGEDNGYDRGIVKIAVDALGSVHALGRITAGTASTVPITAGAWIAGTEIQGASFLFKLAVPNSTTTVSSSGTPVIAGQPVTLTATLAGAKAGGTVTFMDGGVSLGAVVPVRNVATLTVTLSAGVHKITATHSADGKVSPPFLQVVNVQVNN